MPKGKIQMMFITLLGAVATVATFVYLFARPPAYLRETRDGVPYFTPPVVNPVSGKPLNVNTLVRHYKGSTGTGAPAGID
ncbi:MAG: hypothetical protein KGJ12_06665 [Gammaproteobacteria bacterium]|nr:hypothetical protein [Gammaproteobacteria bacterium]